MIRLLNHKFEFCEFDEDKLPPYAILSHTWSENNGEEVTYHDLKHGTTKSRLKLDLCREWAKAEKFEYFWIDTCCIDKTIDAEIKSAIRSMWRWYSAAGVCFVFLSDLSKNKRKRDTDWRDALKDCRWFTRGWTLQELIASKRLEFHASDGYLGSREDLLPTLKNITGINLGNPLPDHATRLSWVAKRITKVPEDRAYCMLGICGVSFDALYGEGEDLAWQRLKHEITRRYGTIALEARGAAATSEHRATVLEALRFRALETRRKTVKGPLAKTCKWILNHPACAKWLKQEHKFFWIKGKPGAGKSVLIKYLDLHVTRQLKKSNAIGLYFYFNARGEQLEKSFEGLYRSLIVQLVDLVPEVAHELDTLDTRFDVQQLQWVLTSIILGLKRTIWIFIDALDECREGDVRELIDFLDGLQEVDLYVCLASRHYPLVQVPTKLQLVLEEVNEHTQDLSTYVEKLDLQGDQLAQMQHDIVAKANGIFLWVVLVVKILQEDVDGGRFFAMQSRLREIPEGLPELFKTIILRDDKHKNEFLLCLRWILYAWRPLTLREWYFAMMAGVGGTLEWHEEITEHVMEKLLLSSSKGLAELTKGKTTTTQFIHESVRDFLVHPQGLEGICSIAESSESVAHEQLKHCCLRGLAFDLPRKLEQRKSRKQLLTEDERTSLRAKYPFAEYATIHILHHADRAAAKLEQGTFMASEFTMASWLDRANAFQKSKPDIYSNVPSLSYLCAERDLARLLPRPTEAVSLEGQQRYKAPLVAAMMNSSWEVLNVLLTDMNVPNGEEVIAEMKSMGKLKHTIGSRRQVAWHWAVTNGLVHLSRHLVSTSSIESVNGSSGLDFALRVASEDGNDKAVKLLIDLGANPNAQGERYGYALQAASHRGHEMIVRTLLAAGANVKAGGGMYGYALQAASVYRHETIVQMLLNAGADVNAQGGEYGNALCAALAYPPSFRPDNYVKVVQLLLDAGADVNARGYRGSALQLALERDNYEVAGMLRAAAAGAIE